MATPVCQYFVLPNAILRHCGADIGKCDFFGAPGTEGH